MTQKFDNDALMTSLGNIQRELEVIHNCIRPSFLFEEKGFYRIEVMKTINGQRYGFAEIADDTSLEAILEQLKKTIPAVLARAEKSLKREIMSLDERINRAFWDDNIEEFTVKKGEANEQNN